MKKFLALLLALAMMFALVACGEKAPAADAPAAEAPAEEASNLVGVAMPTKDLQRWIQDGANMKAQLEAAGYAVDLQYAANDIPTQVSQLQNMVQQGITVVVCSQCLYERSDFSIYQAGQKALEHGVLQGFDMTSEASVTKLMWVLGNHDSSEEISVLMSRSLRGEFNG